MKFTTVSLSRVNFARIGVAYCSQSELDIRRSQL